MGPNLGQIENLALVGCTIWPGLSSGLGMRKTLRLMLCQVCSVPSDSRRVCQNQHQGWWSGSRMQSQQGTGPTGDAFLLFLHSNLVSKKTLSCSYIYEWQWSLCDTDSIIKTMGIAQCNNNDYYLPFAEGRPSLKMQTVVVVVVFLGGSRWWLVGSVHVTFSRHLGKAYTKYCPLSSPKRAECLRVCFHCLSGVVFVTLNHSCRITNVHAGCGRSRRAFLERFLLEMILTTMHTLRPSNWHNVSLVIIVMRKEGGLAVEVEVMVTDASQANVTTTLWYIRISTGLAQKLAWIRELGKKVTYVMH